MKNQTNQTKKDLSLAQISCALQSQQLKSNFGVNHKSNKYKKEKDDLLKDELKQMKENAIKKGKLSKPSKIENPVSIIEEVNKRNYEYESEDFKKITSKNIKYNNNLSLAERWGLVDAPEKPLSVEEWKTIEDKCTKLEMFKSNCPICLESFGVHECNILSCGHVFHKNCIEGFERCSRTRHCPICRRKDQDRKTQFGCNDQYLNNCAIIIQKNYKMLACFKIVQNIFSDKSQVFVQKLGEKRWRNRMLDQKLVLNEIKMKYQAIQMDKQMDNLDQQLDKYQKQVDNLISKSNMRESEVECGEKWEDIKEKGLKYEQTECVICQHEFNSSRQMCMLNCGHIFHTNCMASQERQTLGIKKCPVCRESVKGKKNIVRENCKKFLE